MFLDIGTILGTLLLIIIISLIFDKAGINGYRRKVLGTVVSINGTNLTLKSKVKFSGESTTFTIDASNALVTKNSKSSAELAITPGDTVMVKGMISGIIFTAKTIKDRTPRSKVPPPKDTEIF